MSSNLGIYKIGRDNYIFTTKGKDETKKPSEQLIDYDSNLLQEKKKKCV